jgi:hypothetical protein
MKMQNYRLLNERGDDLGVLHTSTPEWHVGEEIYRLTGEVFKVMAIVPAIEDDEVESFVVVNLLCGGAQVEAVRSSLAA